MSCSWAAHSFGQCSLQRPALSVLDCRVGCKTPCSLQVWLAACLRQACMGFWWAGVVGRRGGGLGGIGLVLGARTQPLRSAASFKGGRCPTSGAGGGCHAHGAVPSHWVQPCMQSCSAPLSHPLCFLRHTPCPPPARLLSTSHPSQCCMQACMSLKQSCAQHVSNFKKLLQTSALQSHVRISWFGRS